MVSSPREKSILHVSDSGSRTAYAFEMARERDRTTNKWGTRFRQAAFRKGWTLAKLAEKLEMSESGLRSWTNGHRQINLSEYINLCDTAELDPAVILFAGNIDPRFILIGEAWVVGNNDHKSVLVTAAKGVLADRGRAGREDRESS